MKKLLLLISLLLISNLALAEKFKILDVTNDDKIEETYEFIIDVDENNLITHFLKISYKDSIVDENDSDKYDVSKIVEGGIVLEKRFGKEVIKLATNNFVPTVGATIEVDYLAKGISGRRKSVFIKMKKDSNETWGLYNMNDEAISSMHIKVKTTFGQPTGIKEVIFE
ncbi:hypothetical protein A9Q84_18765 [Halobacteriovorax marinus]|uniref:Secreted protein n=1 Tax=Halobacteriovorax marinus TaxID=97084 RepID=A0A1Y5F248_9BACT|nr:hypothetical protein A9Q84_18765 [Halobacteriovorax marinus]